MFEETKKEQKTFSYKDHPSIVELVSQHLKVQYDQEELSVRIDLLNQLSAHAVVKYVGYDVGIQDVKIKEGVVVLNSGEIVKFDDTLWTMQKDSDAMCERFNKKGEAFQKLDEELWREVERVFKVKVEKELWRLNLPNKTIEVREVVDHGEMAEMFKKSMVDLGISKLRRNQ